ncbi:MAG: alpha/beta hydrolase [Ferruginibacter sp.]
MNVQQKLALGFIKTKLNLLTALNKKEAGEHAFRLFCTPLAKYIGPESDAFKNSKRLEFTLNGNTIRGFQTNAPQTNKVLILHGFSSSLHNFESYIAPLVAKNYEVLAFDAPAHGRSEGNTIHALDYAEMVKKVIDLYGPIQNFIAHSFGGIALSLALESIPHDEKMKVVLIAPATETSSAIDNALQMLNMKNEALRKAIDEVILHISGKETSWFSIRRAVKNLKASVLWFHDEDDDVTPIKDALAVKDDAHAHVEFVVTTGLGHRRIYRDDAVQQKIFSFF